MFFMCNLLGSEHPGLLKTLNLQEVYSEQHPDETLHLQVPTRHSVGGGQHPVVSTATGVMGAGNSACAGYDDKIRQSITGKSAGIALPYSMLTVLPFSAWCS